MTTGRINQVATAVRGVRPTCRSVGRPASHVQRSPHRSGARVALARRLNGRFSVRSPRRPDGPRIGRSRRGPDRGRQFLSPSRHPLRGRNTQDGQVRNEPRRVAHRSDLDRKTTQRKSTDETLAGPLARWPRSQPGVFEIASSRGRARRSKANRVRRRSTSSQHA